MPIEDIFSSNFPGRRQRWFTGRRSGREGSAEGQGLARGRKDRIIERKLEGEQMKLRIVGLPSEAEEKKEKEVVDRAWRMFAKDAGWKALGGRPNVGLFFGFAGAARKKKKKKKKERDVEGAPGKSGCLQAGAFDVRRHTKFQKAEERKGERKRTWKGKALKA